MTKPTRANRAQTTVRLGVARKMGEDPAGFTFRDLQAELGLTEAATKHLLEVARTLGHLDCTLRSSPMARWAHPRHLERIRAEIEAGIPQRSKDKMARKAERARATRALHKDGLRVTAEDAPELPFVQIRRSAADAPRPVIRGPVSVFDLGSMA